MKEETKPEPKEVSIEEWLYHQVCVFGGDCIMILKFEKGIPKLVGVASDGENLDRLSYHKQTTGTDYVG